MRRTAMFPAATFFAKSKRAVGFSPTWNGRNPKPDRCVFPHIDCIHETWCAQSVKIFFAAREKYALERFKASGDWSWRIDFGWRLFGDCAATAEWRAACATAN